MMRYLALSMLLLAGCAHVAAPVVTPPPIGVPPAPPVVTPPVATDPPPVVTPPAQQQPAPPAAPTLAIGMNLAGLAYWSTEDPFLDKAKMNTWADVPAANKDATGFPNSLPAGTTQWLANTPLSAGGGDYVMLYQGSPAVNTYSDGDHSKQNSLSFVGGANVVMAPGRITFHAPGNSVLYVLTGFDPANPIHDLHIVRADQEAAWRGGAILNPAYLDAIGKRFSPHRYMDWSCTNGSTLVHWADRPKLTDASWSCAPLEVMIAEANASGADMWYNIPHLADDDYVRQAVTLIRDTLAPGLKLHLEYSNEVWNDSFSQTHWAADQAKVLWGDGLWFGNLMFYGYRSAQVMRIAKDVLGDRVIGVYGAFTGYTDPGLDVQIDAGIAKANVGTIAQLFGEYAVTTYFGDQLGSTDAAEQAKILGWANGGEAGMASAFNELEHGGGFSSNFSIDNVARQLWPFHAAQAKQRSLAMVAYEGGLSGYWFAWDRANHPVMIDFLTRLKADPRMGVLYGKMATAFAAAGGVEMTPFNDVGGVTIFGPWGGQPDLATDSPQASTLRALSGR